MLPRVAAPAALEMTTAEAAARTVCEEKAPTQEGSHKYIILHVLVYKTITYLYPYINTSNKPISLENVNTVYHETFVAGNFCEFRCFLYHRESFIPNEIHHRHNT